jgi:hypothetical protein
MRLLEMVAHRGQPRHRRRLDQLGRGAGALDGQRFRARHDGGGGERPLQNIGSIATISSDCGCIYVFAQLPALERIVFATPVCD